MTYSYTLPVSIKGVVLENGFVWLRKNERDFWELPGGKLDKGEQPEQTLVRELKEELGVEVKVIKIIQAYWRTIENSVDEKEGVLTISYLCEPLGKIDTFENLSEGGKVEFKKFLVDDIPKLKMADFYKEVIHEAYNLI